MDRRNIRQSSPKLKKIGKDESESESEFLVRFDLVAGYIVVVLSPLSCAILAEILGIKRSRVELAHRRLHSIFIIPESQFEPIRSCHKSLADYLQDKGRCKAERFHIDSSVLHLELGLRCLQSINTSLNLRMNVD
jgi:hypothetical protein